MLRSFFSPFIYLDTVNRLEFRIIKTGLIVAKTGPTVSEVGMYTSVTAQ